MDHVFKIKNGKYTDKFTDKYVRKHKDKCWEMREFKGTPTNVFIGHGNVRIAIVNLKYGVISKLDFGKAAEGLVLIRKKRKYILLSEFVK